jgi:hypothetical protein
MPLSLWLGREDSNLRMQGPKPCAFPLGDAPLTITHDPLPVIHEGKINGAARVLNPCSGIRLNLSGVDKFRLGFKDRIHKK